MNNQVQSNNIFSYKSQISTQRSQSSPLIFNLIYFLALALFSNLMLSGPALGAKQISPKQLAQRIYDRYLGDDMKMQGQMELISKNGHVRSREFISMRKDKGDDRMQLIRFTSPEDIKGTAFLTLEEAGSSKTEQHLYLPALKRTRRIVASQKGRSFVNSDFTYEDMQRHPVEDWQYQTDAEERSLGRDCYILISTPKPETETQYSKIRSWIDKEHFMALQTIFWDKKGRETKKYTVNSFEIVNQIATETDVLMENLQSKHKTRLKTLAIVYNSGLQDSLFTKRALER